MKWNGWLYLVEAHAKRAAGELVYLIPCAYAGLIGNDLWCAIGAGTFEDPGDARYV